RGRKKTSDCTSSRELPPVKNTMVMNAAKTYSWISFPPSRFCNLPSFFVKLPDIKRLPLAKKPLANTFLRIHRSGTCSLWVATIFMIGNEVLGKVCLTLQVKCCPEIDNRR